MSKQRLQLRSYEVIRMHEEEDEVQRCRATLASEVAQCYDSIPRRSRWRQGLPLLSCKIRTVLEDSDED